MIVASQLTIPNVDGRFESFPGKTNLLSSECLLLSSWTDECMRVGSEALKRRPVSVRRHERRCQPRFSLLDPSTTQDHHHHDNNNNLYHNHHYHICRAIIIADCHYGLYRRRSDSCQEPPWPCQISSLYLSMWPTTSSPSSIKAHSRSFIPT